jgi:hypothetical protein
VPDDAELARQWQQEIRSAPLPPVSGWVEDPSQPSGWRWEPDLARLPHMADPTGVMPAVRRDPPPVQEDLTRFDLGYGVVNTEKLGPGDELIPQPPQDPDWRPDGEPS